MATSTLGSGTLVLAGTTSGTTTVTATAVAGTTTLTLPAATDTLVGKATTDTLTNKTLTGAAMNGTVGATTPSTGAFTTLSTSGAFTTTGGSNVQTSWTLAEAGTRSLVLKNPTSTLNASVGTGTNHDLQVEGNSLYFFTGSFGSRSTAGTFDSSGNLGVGLTSPASKVDVSSASTGVVKFTSGKSGWLYADSAGIALSDTSDFTKNGLYINNTSNYVAVYTGSTGAERARIDSSGNLQVSNSGSNPAVTGWAGFAVSPVGAVSLSRNGSNVLAFFHTSNANGTSGSPVGTVSITTTATTYSTSSDYRLKHDIQPMTGALAKVSALKPVTYKWNLDDSGSQGFIAHELAEVCPQAVVGEKDAVETYLDEEGNEATRPVYQGIDTSFLVATLTAAIQEQQALITQLTARITALESA